MNRHQRRQAKKLRIAGGGDRGLADHTIQRDWHFHICNPEDGPMLKRYTTGLWRSSLRILMWCIFSGLSPIGLAATILR